MKIGELLQTAADDYAKLFARCETFDKELMADMTKVGGEKYAKITALSYRECVAANGLAADANEQPLFFTKENTSNGDIATVDGSSRWTRSGSFSARRWPRPRWSTC